jgi:hypothetical protein
MTGISQADNINSFHIAVNHSYQICLDDAVPDSIKKDNNLMMSCPDRVCLECGNDHSFRGNFEDAITIIDLLPELFPEIFKSNSSSISTNELQGFVN